MGTLDRVIRLSLALLIGVLFYFEIITGVLGTLLLVIATLFLLTSIFAICPLYSAFGLYTCAIKNTTEE